MGIGSELGWVTFSKVGVELPEEERDSIEQWIVENTQEKFGPVHRLPAVQVFTIECGSIEESKRTKSGYSVKDAVMKSWEIGSPMEVVADKSTISAILPKR
jgi:DNA ligase-1